MLPTGEMSLSELRQQWDATHAWLRSFAARLDSADADRAVFFHPVTGPLTCAQAVRLAGVHLGTHTHQMPG